MKFDFYDLLLLIGLGLVGYGLYLISLSLALVVVGGLLMAFALFGASIKAAGRRQNR